MPSNYRQHPDEPAPGDLINLLEADGEPGFRYSRVQRVLSNDFEQDLHEVIDRQGRHMIVAPAEGEEWVQTLIEP